MHKVLNTLNLSMLHVGHADLSHEWQFDKVISPFSRLYLITEGEAWIFHNGRKYELRPHHLYLIPSFTYSRYHCEETMSQYYISFLEEIQEDMSIYELFDFVYEKQASSLDKELFQRLLHLNPGKTILQSDPKTYDNRPDLLSYNQQSTQAYDNYLESKAILLQLFSRFITSKKKLTETELKSHRRLASVIRYIDKHISEKLSVEELAAMVYLHPDYFSRLFLEINGVRPLEFINNKRLDQAQVLLLTTGLTITEIAIRVGIPHLSYFNRLFKDKFGMTPGAFRKANLPV